MSLIPPVAPPQKVGQLPRSVAANYHLEVLIFESDLPRRRPFPSRAVRLDDELMGWPGSGVLPNKPVREPLKAKRHAGFKEPSRRRPAVRRHSSRLGCSLRSPSRSEGQARLNRGTPSGLGSGLVTRTKWWALAGRSETMAQWSGSVGSRPAIAFGLECKDVSRDSMCRHGIASDATSKARTACGQPP